MATRRKTFDAVLASRRWKEAVARKTAGLTAAQVLVFFNRERTPARTRSLTKRATGRVAA